MTSLANLPETRIEDLPIPEDVQPSKLWTASMREMADHIGPYATMQIVDCWGGLELYVPRSAETWHVARLIGQTAAQKLCSTYGRERLPIPRARAAVASAKRQGIIAAVRAKRLSLTEGAHILRTSRTYLSALVNGSDEGTLALPFIPKSRPHIGQFELFEQEPGQ
jgi:hypothetical protein